MHDEHPWLRRRVSPGRLAFQVVELADLLAHAGREFSFGSQILLQSFADFSTDRSAVGVINVDGVAHDGPRCPNEPRPMIIPGLRNPVLIPVPIESFRVVAFTRALIFCALREPREHH